MRLLSWTYPADSFVVEPLSLALCLVFYAKEDARSVHHIILESPYELVAVCICLEALTLHLSLFEVAFVPGVVRPEQHAFALHVVVMKFTFV